MDAVLQREAAIGTSKITDYGLVSIIMPNYNSSDFIKETVECVIAQTYQNWELLIVDDCSTDDSLKVLAQFDDDRLKVIKNQENCGAAISRNRAIEAANGRWIAFLDSDDLWAENKLEGHLAFMVKEKELEKKAIIEQGGIVHTPMEEKMIAEIREDAKEYEVTTKTRKKKIRSLLPSKLEKLKFWKKWKKSE